jgi:hypothetical protein
VATRSEGGGVEVDDGGAGMASGRGWQLHTPRLGLRWWCGPGPGMRRWRAPGLGTRTADGGGMTVSRAT